MDHKSTRKWIGLIFILLTSGGCGIRSTGLRDIMFTSDNEVPVFVSAVRGFKDEPVCGALSQHGESSFTGYRQPVPNKIEIVWWKGTTFKEKKSAPVTSEVSIPPVNSKQQPGKLVLRFTKDETWVASFAAED